MNCSVCWKGALVTVQMPGGTEEDTVTRCATCGAERSSLDCATRACQSFAVGRCLDCSKPFCRRHGHAGKAPWCDKCRRRTASVLRPMRRR